MDKTSTPDSTTLDESAPDAHRRPGASGKDPRWWVFSTYFAQGFPYTVVRAMSSVFCTDVGMSERFPHSG